MLKSRPPYPAEFRQRIIELAATGKTPDELSREFGPTTQTLLNWLAQAACDAGKALRGDVGGRPSRGRVGDAYDDAMAESFFASLECELPNRRSFRSKVEARLAVFTGIEGWDNPRRRHSALGYLAPQTFEEQHHRPSHPLHPEHGLPTGPLASGQRGASGGPVDNPALVVHSTA